MRIRFALKRDISQIAEIDASCFAESSWGQNNYGASLERRHGVTMVSEEGKGHLVGFCRYILRPCDIDLVRVAVAPEHRRSGIGSAMLRKVESKCDANRRHVFCTVNEYDLGCQLFFKSCGWLCTGVMRLINPESPDLLIFAKALVSSSSQQKAEAAVQ